MLRKTLGISIIVGALTGCSTTLENSDPYEGFNRDVFSFNKTVDKAIIKPTAIGYRKVVPQFMQAGVTNFFNNLGEIPTIANDLFQLKLSDAAFDATRFVTNTVFGAAGLVDVATYLGMERKVEDFGQTLMHYGVKKSPYFVLPLLGPSTVRDAIGRIPDYYLSPYGLVDDMSTRNALVGGRFIERRAYILANEQVMDTVAVDEYTFVRDAYLQSREHISNDGELSEDDELLGEPE